MPIFLILVLEVILFGYFTDHFGFLNTLGAYWLPTFFLMTLIPYLTSRLQGFTMQSMDTSGNSINKQLNRILIVVGGFALMIPLLSTRLIGLLLILPGFRQLLLWKFKSAVQKKTNQYFGNFSTNGGGFQFFYHRGGQRGFGNSFEDFQQPAMKDVTPTEPEQIQNVQRIGSSRNVDGSRPSDDSDSI